MGKSQARQQPGGTSIVWYAWNLVLHELTALITRDCPSPKLAKLAVLEHVELICFHCPKTFIVLSIVPG